MNIARTNLGDAAAASTIDAANPWLGLASFTEETRQYFYGREEEVAELARRVQRKLLTILFGQSGLGKTSILRAGLVPRLRAQGYCPVYVRIDYGREAPEPSEQIKRVILRTASRSGQWTQSGVAEAGESLWEFLHHRDDVLQDTSGTTLVPLLIFDQFEEIFTLAQADDFARELETFGRLDIVAELAKRQVDYFNALPPTLRGPESVRHGARAMVYYAGAMRRLGKSQVATPAASEAKRLLEQLRAQGDTSEATTIVLALAGAVQAKIFSNQQNPQALPTAQRAAELLKPVAEGPQASVAARRAYVEVLTGFGYEQQAQIGNEKDAVVTLQLAKETAAQLGARDLSNMEMAARYAEAGTWQAQALIALGRNAEARQVGSDASAI